MQAPTVIRFTPVTPYQSVAHYVERPSTMASTPTLAVLRSAAALLDRIATVTDGLRSASRSHKRRLVDPSPHRDNHKILADELGHVDDNEGPPTMLD